MSDEILVVPVTAGQGVFVRHEGWCALLVTVSKKAMNKGETVAVGVFRAIRARRRYAGSRSLRNPEAELPGFGQSPNRRKKIRFLC